MSYTVFSKRCRVEVREAEQEDRDTDRKQTAGKTFTSFVK